MLTVKDQEKKLRSEAADCSAEVKRIKRDCADEIKYARGRSADRLADIRARLKEVRALGGVCDVHEAARVLKVSRQRVQTLIKDGRIRVKDSEVSLASVKAYGKGPRKPGPKKSLRRARDRGPGSATNKGAK